MSVSLPASTPPGHRSCLLARIPNPGGAAAAHSATSVRRSSNSSRDVNTTSACGQRLGYIRLVDGSVTLWRAGLHLCQCVSSCGKHVGWRPGPAAGCACWCVADAARESGKMSLSYSPAGMIRRRGDMATGWGRQVSDCGSMVGPHLLVCSSAMPGSLKLVVQQVLVRAQQVAVGSKQRVRLRLRAVHGGATSS